MSLLSSCVVRSSMFEGAAAFNEDLSKWSTSSVTNMKFVFIASAVACMRSALVVAMALVRPRFHIRYERD